MFTSYKRMSHLKTIVGPASKLHLAVLVVKREPRDVNQAGGLKKVKSEKRFFKSLRRKTYLKYRKVTLNIPGGMYVQWPSFVTTTFVGYVPSNFSSALQTLKIVKCQI